MVAGVLGKPSAVGVPSGSAEGGAWPNMAAGAKALPGPSADAADGVATTQRPASMVGVGAEAPPRPPSVGAGSALEKAVAGKAVECGVPPGAATLP